jgi:hypothetical protein
MKTSLEGIEWAPGISPIAVASRGIRALSAFAEVRLKARPTETIGTGDLGFFDK